MRPSVVVEAYDLRIPGWVVDLDSFHRWIDSKEGPRRGRIDYLQGELWVDMGEEHQASVHAPNGHSPARFAGTRPRGKTPSYAVVIEGDNVAVPASVTDLASFRRWANSEDFPEHGRVSYLAGEVWIDMSMEQLFSDNKVKTEFFIVLGSLVKSGRLGDFFSDGVSVSCPPADLSTVPDAVFLSRQGVRSGRVRLIAGARQGFVEIEGSPDMVLEVVSDASVRKDTVRLRELYWAARVREYWLVDARRGPVTFDVLRRTPRGFAVARKQAGWLRSAVFGKEFHLTHRMDEQGNPEYTLEVR